MLIRKPTFTTYMEKTDFLLNNIFTDLQNVNQGADKGDVYHFSELDFETVLERVEHFGLGVFEIETWLNGASTSSVGHEEHKKKATDPKWYKKAYLTFKSKQEGLNFSATYKVPTKLLERNKVTESQEEE